MNSYVWHDFYNVCKFWIKINNLIFYMFIHVQFDFYVDQI
jgi:hypothetical protein